LKPVAPYFCPHIFRKKGASELSARKRKREESRGRKRHKPAQTGTKRHKSTQTGTIFCAAGLILTLCDGGSSLAPLIVRDLLLRSAESAQSHDGAVERVTSAGWRREERGAWGTAAEKTTEGTTLTPWQRRSFYRNRGRVPVLDVAVTAVTFGRCPAPSRRCCFRLFDCRICPHRQCHFIGIIFIIIIVVAPFLSPFPLPPPTDRRLRVAFLDGAPSLRGRGQEGLGGVAHQRRCWSCRDGQRQWPLALCQ